MMGVLVANPGAGPEFPMLAAGLARADLLGGYVAPMSFSREQATAPRILPRSIRIRVETELRRRTLPHEISMALVRRRATMSELAFVGAQRLNVPSGLAHLLIAGRNSRFDRDVARMLASVSWSGFVGAQGASVESLQTANALGIPTFLHSAIAHHRHAQRILAEEIKLQPKFAQTMQYHDFSKSMERQVEDEVALAHRILVLSSYQARTFVEEGVDPQRLVLTPLGVDTELFKPPPARPERHGLQILFVGQLTQRKGLSYLLEAFIQAAIRGSQLVLVGRPIGNALEVIRQIPGARHIPHVPRWLLPATYAAADAFVLPSLVEGFPLTALEAMACGLPVIVSEHTFGPDVVTDGTDGYVVPIRDSASIAHRLTQLAESPALRTRMGNNAAARARDFAWEHYGSVASTLIGRAIESESSRPRRG